MIAEGSLQGVARERTQIGTNFLQIYAFEPAALGGRKLHRSYTFNQGFANFPLSILEAEKGNVGLG